MVKKKVVSGLDPSKGGEARAHSLSAERRKEIARNAVNARWARTKTTKQAHTKNKPASDLPVAKYKGFLNIMDVDLPCYVLDTGERIIGRVAATEMLSGFPRQGDLEGYLRSQNLRPYIDKDLVVARMVSFSLPEVVTPRQISMAIKASMFLVACAKVGLDALVDEATGYQAFRDSDALQVKLRAYLEKEMRKWERTFPDELWIEFGRLTDWKGSVTHRPKYWGHLVIQLIYEYLDPDVAAWLKANAPAPRKGQNYHQWLTAQYGLKKLIEHIWMVVGIARTCYNMDELKQKMRQMFGKGNVQYDLFMPTPQQVRALPAAQPLTKAQIEAEKAELHAS